jgi:DNA-binding NarL/FixJ family response regulator
MPKRILIADDSAVIRKALRTMFDRVPHWIVCGEASNGQEAIEKAQELNPDLILLDLSMPVMNGVEAARELKRIYPAMPLLMFTNFKTPNLEKEALAAGFSAVVSKSEASPHLLESINDLFKSGSDVSSCG